MCSVSEFSGSSKTDTLDTVTSASGTTLAPIAHIADDTSNIPIQEDGDGGRLSSGSRAGQEERKPTLVRDRVIKTVLSLDLDPVTEIPGEGPGESEEDWDVGGRPFGSGNVRGPRRSSGSRRSSRGCSSTIIQSSEVGEGGGETSVAGVSGGEHGVIVEEGEDCCGEVVGGLVVEVRVSAPVICVLLVHDEEVGSDYDGDEEISRSSYAGDEAGFLPGDNDVIGSSMQPDEGRVKVAKGRQDGLVDGALLLLEISGLRVEYRDTLGGGQAGGVGGSIEGIENGTRRGGPTVVRHNHNFCLTAASFAAKDVYQRVGNEYSYMLSSRDPLSSITMVGISGGGSASGCGSEASQGVKSPSRTDDNAIRITRTLSKGGDIESGVVARSTVIAIGGIWANWNPETVAALSIFAYGMYGHRGNGDNSGDGGKIDPGVRVQSSLEASDRDMLGDGASMSEAVRVVGGGSTGTPGGVVVVEIKRVSLWLNKEVHGRRLLLFEAGDSTVSTTEDPLEGGCSLSAVERACEIGFVFWSLGVLNLALV